MTTARCAVHDEVESTGVCSRCGRFLCAACSDAVHEGWCVACGSRPEARLHISRGARLSLGLAVGGVVLPLLSLVALWRVMLPGRTTPADAPVVQAARWLAVATLALWAAVIVVRALG